jgi:hypothetical protein
MLIQKLASASQKSPHPWTRWSETYGFVDPSGAKYVIVANRSASEPVYFRSPFASATDVLTGAKVGSGISIEAGGGKMLGVD